MAVTPTPIYPQAFANDVQTIVAADTTTVKALSAGATNGSKVESLLVTNTDTAAHTIQIWLTISAVNYLIGTFTIPISSGNTAAALATSVLSLIPGLPRDAFGNPYIYLASGTTLSISATVTVAAGTITATASRLNF